MAVMYDKLLQMDRETEIWVERRKDERRRP